MSIWEQFAIQQGIAALHTVIRRYGAKYLTADELAAGDVLLDALGELPERVHSASATVAK